MDSKLHSRFVLRHRGLPRGFRQVHLTARFELANQREKWAPARARSEVIARAVTDGLGHCSGNRRFFCGLETGHAIATLVARNTDGTLSLQADVSVKQCPG